MYKEILDIYCEHQMNRTNTACGKVQSFLLLQQVVHMVNNGLEMVNNALFIRTKLTYICVNIRHLLSVTPTVHLTVLINKTVFYTPE